MVISAATSTSDASSVVQNLLKSLAGNKGSGGRQVEAPNKPFTTLADLLTPASTIPTIESGDADYIDNLLGYLPPVLLLLAQEVDDISSVDPNSEIAQAAMQALSLDQKKDILRRVLRSPQFTQSCSSLTFALRDGGLPSVSDALKIKVENGGFMRRGGMPLGGGEAVEAFLEGVKKQVEQEKSVHGENMETE
jgi:26S proteasome regulatory subunit N13